MNPKQVRLRPFGKKGFLALAAMFLMVGLAYSQESRGTLTGTVTDGNGAGVPNASVAVTSRATSVAANTTTNGDGGYTVPFLTPGFYSVTIEANGFKKQIRDNLEIRVADRVALDIQLEIGDISQTVTVNGDSTPLLESETATVGQVVDRRRISELPLADGNPFTLFRLANGVTVTSFSAASTQPFSNSDQSSAVTNGAQGGNEYNLDGAPNTIDKRPGIGNRVGYVPSTDSVQEFKITTSSFDAQQGRTAGFVADVAIKSGSNAFNGTLYEFVRNDVFSANNFSTNRSASLGFYEDGTARRPIRRYNRFGGTVGGPVYFLNFGEGVPAIYNGTNRTFFFTSYEAIKNITPRPVVFTVPTEAQRRGDLSALLASNIRIYDPLTAQCTTTAGAVVPPTTSGGQITGCPSGSRPTRQPFANNIIPTNRISPVAQAYLRFFPLPNQPGDSLGRNNYATNNATTNDYYAFITRIDHSFNGNHKIFGRYALNRRNENDENFTGVTNGVRATGFQETRKNTNIVGDYVGNLSNSFFLNVRGSYSHHYNPSFSQSEADGFDIGTLGFSQTALGQFGGYQGVPRLDISNIVELGGRSVDLVNHYVYAIQPTATWLIGNKSIRFGYDYRVFQEDSRPPSDVAGRYRFRNDFTRQNDSSATNAVFGQELAAFLLGVPASNSVIVRPAFRDNETKYHGIFVQDDWKLLSHLTLNLGLRYEYEVAPTEKLNRNVRFFDTTSTSPINGRVRANYAAGTQVPEVPLANFNLRGGLVFTDDQNPRFYETDKNNFQPRIGLAYQLNGKTVIRGGFAVYNAPFTFDGINQSGYTQETFVNPSTNNGLTIIASTENPFPAGVVEPPGSSRGLATFVGQGLGGSVDLLTAAYDRRVNPLTVEPRKNPKFYRYEFSIQRELFGGWVAEAAYIGSRGVDLTTIVDINPIPRQYQSTGPIRNQTLINFLDANFTNPFRNVAEAIGTNFFTSSNLARSQFLRPFPQYTSINVYRHDGESQYDSLQTRLEKRFSSGYTVLATYTFSKSLEEVTKLNATDESYERRLSATDTPHRFVLSGIYELPFGRGRRFASGASGWAEALIGGFQLQGIYQYQSGFPLTLGNIYYNGNLSDLKIKIKGDTIGRLGTTNVTDNVFGIDISRSGFYRLPDGTVVPFTDTLINLSQNIRTLPSRASNLRTTEISIFDVSLIKNVNFTERYKLQLRVEMLNAFNTPIFGSPDLNPRSASFGRVAGEQVNLAREFQLGAKFIF